MASIIKRILVRPDGSKVVKYDAIVTRRGYKRVTKRFKKKTNAEAWARQVEGQIETKSYMDISLAEKTTVEDLLKRYLTDVSPLKKAGDRDISYVNAVVRRLGSIPLSGLEPRHIAEYRDARLKDKRQNGSDGKIGAATVTHELGILQRALKVGAQEWGLSLPRGLPTALVRRPKQPRGRDRRVTADELVRLLEACTQNMEPGAAYARTPWLRPLVEFAIETGARRGELVNLKWKNVDLKKRIARLIDTKNGEDRELPLSSRAVTALQGLPRSINGNVFPITANALKLQWKRALKRAEIENLHLHDLRHEATSRLFELGLNPMEVASITGHKTLQMLKRYTHLKAEDLAKKLG